MKLPRARSLVVTWAALALAAALPLVSRNDYLLGLSINLVQYSLMATAWAMFSGPTRYVSLASVAFYGIGAYAVAVLGDKLPQPLVFAVALVAGSLLSLLVGLATLRLSGIYFVIFTFGLAELVRQLVTWYEVNVTKTLGRYVFLDITPRQIYWELLALLALLFAFAWWVKRSRLGLALQVIGDDETVARHVGIDVTRAKLVLFVASSAFITLTGAIMAPRWTYIDPAISFNPVVSFQVVIMALLGGAGSLFGPVAGAVPLALLFEFLSAHFPNHFSILLGVAFMVIVYFVPDGVASWIHKRLRRAKGATQ
ncbi:MAG TPA: branched-chain amino acid ABC transporter permease [Burkholderiaceae bacterium]|nr:branched-chain amino acid ABC transporter permease [Burkholderiaceae bacterium]